jgi:hypothetical protein
MLTVDQVRRELEKTGELPGREKRPRNRKEAGEMRAEKVARAIPETLDKRWIYHSRKSELKKVLAERYRVAEGLLGGDLNSLRNIAKDNIAGKRKRSASPARTARAKVQRGPKLEGNGVPRLVLAETFACPSCGAQLMMGK